MQILAACHGRFDSVHLHWSNTDKMRKEANTMDKEPIYRIKVEVIGDEKDGNKIDETLRGGSL